HLIRGLLLTYDLIKINSEFQKHEKREFVTLEDLQRGLGLQVGGAHFQAKRWYPSRNNVAYFAASILGPLSLSLTVLRLPADIASFPVSYLVYLTVGWACIYWLYVSAHAPEPHFVVQSHLARELQQILTGLQKVGPLSSIGGAM